MTINAQMLNFYGAMVAFAVDAVVTVVVTLFTTVKPVGEAQGSGWGVPDPDAGDPHEGYVRQVVRVAQASSASPPWVSSSFCRSSSSEGGKAHVSARTDLRRLQPKDAPASAASKLFDLRVLIGALFTFYGVALTIYSFFTTPEEIAKAAGININLWLGLGMLIIGGFFTTWWRLRPFGPGSSAGR